MGMRARTDKRITTATVVVSQQDPQFICAQLFLGCKTTAALQHETGHVLDADKDVTRTDLLYAQSPLISSSSSRSRLGSEQIAVDHDR